MPVIPELGLSNFLGGGGTETHFNNRADMEAYLDNWMSDSSNYVEVTFFQFSDGTFLVYRDDESTASYNKVPTIQYNPSTNIYSYNGQTIIGRGHTHDDNSFPSNSDFESSAKTPGLSTSVYVGNGIYVTYGSNNYNGQG